MKKITIKDIARMAEVSPTTVSLVLNKKPSRISEEKKELIYKLAKQYGYTPNLNARGLVSNKTNMIGLIIPDIENPFFASLAKVIEEEVDKRGQSLILLNTNDSYEKDISGLRLLNMRGVDAFLIVFSNEAYSHEKELKELLAELNKPFVLLDRTFDTINCNQVIFDNHKGQMLATEFLVDKGFKNIGYIAAPEHSLNGEKRLMGYLDVMKRNNFPTNLFVYGNYRFDSGYELVEELVKKDIDSLVIANDVMAYGALKKLNELGIMVPDDISVIGYDDLIYSSMSLTSLSTVRQDQSHLGRIGVELLYKNIREKTHIEKIILEPELIIRKSIKEK
ncbi:LacI family DNA-binding transcriptional regulator [Haploplasma modicum]|uniref:LacI family DNA-binding transcriptional regulator n=1 Tax=Haploplasma modicum TaxID=2150 RepID=UPI00054DDD0B|nr:LacI family DNA-binding transcriptional regulator [Haploplasma modicum]